MVFALLRAFRGRCSSLWTVKSKLSYDFSYDRFQGQAGPRQVIDLSRLDAELKRTTLGMDWVSACRGPFLQVLVIDWVVDTFIWYNQEIYVKARFSSTVCAFQSLCRDRFGQQVLWSEVRTLGLLGARPGLLGSPWILP